MPLMFFQTLKSPAASGGTKVNYYVSIPENSVGDDGDIAIITSNRSHYVKVSGSWVLQMGEVTIPNGIAVYSNRAEMLGALNPSANQLAIVSTEIGNTYLRNSDNTKWIVLTGNKYATVDLPTDVDFIIPSGTVIWDITLSKHLYE